MPRRRPRLRACLSRPANPSHSPSASAVSCLMIVAVVEGHPERIGVWQRLHREQILPAQRDPIEPELLRGEIDEALHHEHGFRAPGRAIRPRRDGIGQHGARAKARGRHLIDARHHLDALLERRERYGVRADIRRVGAAHGEETAIRVQGQLGLQREIAPLIVGEERLMPLAGPLHRLPHTPCRPCDECEFGEEAAPRSVIAAHVVHHDPDALGRHVQNPREVVLLAHRRAAAGVECVAAGRGIIGRNRGPRLHRDAGHALDQGLDLHHAGGVGERRRRCHGITDDGVDAKVRCGVVP